MRCMLQKIFIQQTSRKMITETVSWSMLPGELVGTVTTDKDGKAQITDLPLGTYKIVEKTAPEGFVLNEEAQTVTFEYKDQKTPVIEQTATFENDRQKVEVSVVKQDAETETVCGRCRVWHLCKRRYSDT